MQEYSTSKPLYTHVYVHKHEARVAESDVCPCEKEEWLILFGIGRLKLIAQPEPPLVLQLKPHHCLTESTAVWADYAQSRPYVSEKRANNINKRINLSMGFQSHTEESLKHRVLKIYICTNVNSSLVLQMYITPTAT